MPLAERISVTPPQTGQTEGISSLLLSRQVLFDLRDDHISLVDTNHITDAEFQAFQDT